MIWMPKITERGVQKCSSCDHRSILIKLTWPFVTVLFGGGLWHFSYWGHYRKSRGQIILKLSLKEKKESPFWLPSCCPVYCNLIFKSNSQALPKLNPSPYKYVHCHCSVHRVQFVHLCSCFHLKNAFTRAPGAGSRPTCYHLTDRLSRGRGTEGIQGQDTNRESGGERDREKEREERGWEGEKCEQNRKTTNDSKVRRQRGGMWRKGACHWGWGERNAAAASNMYKKLRGQLPEFSCTWTQYNVYSTTTDGERGEAMQSYWPVFYLWWLINLREHI